VVQAFSRATEPPEDRHINRPLGSKAVKPPFGLSTIIARIASQRDPCAPVGHQLQHLVTLIAPTSDTQLHALWQEAQDWCHQHVHHNRSDQWSRRRDGQTGELVFSFTDLTTATAFKLTFG
jgi:hypothetical protein